MSRVVKYPDDLWLGKAKILPKNYATFLLSLKYTAIPENLQEALKRKTTCHFQEMAGVENYSISSYEQDIVTDLRSNPISPIANMIDSS